MTDKEIQDTIKELSDKEQKELEQAIKQLNSQVNTKPQVNNSKTLKNSSNNARPTSNNISSEKQSNTKKLNPFSAFLNFNSARLSGIYPIILNPAKLFAIMKKENPETTPETSRNDLGVGVNVYSGNKVVEANDNNVKKLRLDNDFNTTLDVIKLFADEGQNILSPKAFINCINAIMTKYIGTNKQDLLTHISYLAEVIYQHFSTLVSNDVVERDDFFNNTTGLDYVAVSECAEFYYTDYLFLNKKEKDELEKVINSYYLEKEVSTVKNKTNDKTNNKSLNTTTAEKFSNNSNETSTNTFETETQSNSENTETPSNNSD